MEAAQKELMEQQSGPLTNIGSTQGFFPYKLFASASEQSEIVRMIEDDLEKVTPFQRKQYQRTIEHLKDDKSANLQMVLIPARAGYEEAISDQSKVFPPAPGKDMAITGAVCLQYPLSRGSIHIKSANQEDHPTIDPAFLKHPADAAVLAAGLKVSRTALGFIALIIC
jgi:choline dehydrogenase-like flavoprotein